MERVTVEEAQSHFIELIERVRTSGEIAVIAGPHGDLVQVTPIFKPAYYHKGRPVYTEEQLEKMPAKYPDESEWVKALLEKNATKPD